MFTDTAALAIAMLAVRIAKPPAARLRGYIGEAFYPSGHVLALPCASSMYFFVRGARHAVHAPIERRPRRPARFAANL
jgi:hypothetical protein